MGDADLSNKVSRRRILEIGALGAAGMAGAGLLSGSGRAFAAALEAGSLPYTAHTNVKGSITFWHFWGSSVRRPVIEAIVTDFQKVYPGVSVNAQYIPFGGIYEKLIAAVAAGQGMPDAIIEDRPQLRTRAALKIDENLGSLAKRDKVNFSVFWPANAQEALVNGDPYGLPYETDTRVMFYNKTAFQQAGLDPNKPPLDWTELAAAANKLDAKSGNGSQLQRVAFYPLFDLGLDVWAWNNGGLWQTSNYTPTINAQANIDALAWIKGWADRYGNDKLNALKATFGPDGPTDAFMTSKQIMRVTIPGYQRFLNLTPPSFQYGVSAIPHAAGHKSAAPAGGFAVAIPTNKRRDSATMNAAWEFTKYLAFVGQIKWAEGTYAIPTLESVAKDNATLNSFPNWKTFIAAMGYTRAGVYNPYYPTMLADVLPPAQDAVTAGQLTSAQALARAQNSAQQEINRVRR